MLQCSFAPPVTGQAAKPLPKLSNRIESLIEQKILPAYQRGDRLELLKALSSATARMKSAQLEAFDEHLRTLSMPPAGRLMVDGYLSLLTQGQANDLPNPDLRQVLVMLPDLDARINDVIVEVDRSAATLEPLPKLETLEDYESLFWEIHVLQNKLKNAANYARYGAKLVADSKKKKQIRNLSEQLAKLEAFGNPLEQLQEIYKDLEQRELESRLNRMELSLVVLQSNNAFIERLQAAFAGQQDSLVLKRVLSGSEPTAFDRERLNAPDLKQTVEQLAQRTDALSGDLKEQSQQFFGGLHWWLRGRFGSGPEQQGLLKNVRVVNDDGLLFPLFILKRWVSRLTKSPAILTGRAATTSKRSPTSASRPQAN